MSETDLLYIPTGSNMDDVYKLLSSENIVEDMATFKRAANFLKFNKVRAGRYKIKNRMSNKALIDMLRSGNQSAVRLTFSGNIRSNQKIASLASRNIETDSIAILEVLNDNAFLSQFGFNRNTVMGMFIPNTYEVYWNITAEGFVERMYKEYNRFWNEDRKSKIDKLNMSQGDVITLASIVAEETNVVDEMPTIAGVYLNRIKVGMPLQADPTVKFALGDFSIRRVLNRHTDYDSPYNTYKNAGLPPSPICMPPIAAIDAVLNYENHEYYYFCANSDFSGRHAFAKTLSQHNLNAQAYQRELNKKGIR